MQLIFFRTVLSVLAALVGFIIAAFTHPALGMIAAIILFLAAGPIVDLTRKKASPAAGAGAPISESETHVVGSTKPAVKVAQRKTRIQLSVGAVVAIVGLMAWLYWDTVRPNAGVLTGLIEDKASALLGDGYSVDGVSLPSGTLPYQYSASVQITEKASSRQDMITLIVTGDCEKGCRIGVDPADAPRLAIKTN